MIKAVIFDLDGTIADTIDAIKHGINLTMSALSYPLSTREDILRSINGGARRLVRLSLPDEIGKDEKKVDEALALYNEMYEKTYMETNVTYDGIGALTEVLHDAGIKLSVLSNKQDSFVKRLCPALLNGEYFTEFRGQKEGAPTKPDPTVPLEICTLMGAKPCECAFVGDSDIDMLTAKNAGFYAIGVSWGYRSKELLVKSGADIIADSPEDIKNIILKK